MSTIIPPTEILQNKLHLILFTSPDGGFWYQLGNIERVAQEKGVARIPECTSIMCGSHEGSSAGHLWLGHEQ